MVVEVEDGALADVDEEADIFAASIELLVVVYENNCG